jgi:hypothetical protein
LYQEEDKFNAADVNEMHKIQDFVFRETRNFILNLPAEAKQKLVRDLKDSSLSPYFHVVMTHYLYTLSQKDKILFLSYENTQN